MQNQDCTADPSVLSFGISENPLSQCARSRIIMIKNYTPLLHFLNFSIDFWQTNSHIPFQEFIQEKIGPENRPFAKISDFKTDPSQKSDLRTGPKIKNYNVIFHTRSAINEFTRK